MLPGVFKKIVHIVALVIYVVIFIYALLCAPMIFGYKPLVVLSGSMEPTLKEGSIVYYKKVNTNELKVGDIITFKSRDNNFVSHRIEKINENTFTTKGDANNTIDPSEVPFGNVLGKDTNFCIPIVGFAVRYINENLWICIPIIIILVLEFLLSNKDFDINNNEERSEL